MNILIMLIWLIALGASIYEIHYSVGHEVLFIIIMIVTTIMTWFITTQAQLFMPQTSTGYTFLEEHVSAGLITWLTPGILISGTIAFIDDVIDKIKENKRGRD